MDEQTYTVVFPEGGRQQCVSAKQVGTYFPEINMGIFDNFPLDMIILVMSGDQQIVISKEGM